MIYSAEYRVLPKEYQHAETIKLLSIGLKIEEDIDYFSEPIAISSLGKPRLRNHSNIHYNISHCKNFIACIISKKHEVGIDIEDIKDFKFSTAKRVCTQEELSKVYSGKCINREFFKYWTLKESFIKAVGLGLSFNMKNIEFYEINNSNIISNQKNCTFYILEKDKYILGACYREI